MSSVINSNCLSEQEKNIPPDIFSRALVGISVYFCAVTIILKLICLPLENILARIPLLLFFN